MRRIVGLLGGLAVMTGCTADPGFTGVSGVREIDAAGAEQCKYLTDISGTPGTYGLLAGQGVSYARNRILDTARQSGANAVVFDKVTPGADVYALHAVAYSCP